MFGKLFWLVLRTIVVPYVAYLILRVTFLGEQGAILAVALALAIVTALSIIWNIVKILGNTLLLRGNTVIFLTFTVVLQLISLAFVWFYYISQYSDLLS